MWQRFTERARRAVFLAQEQAVKHGTAEVTPELLLLAIVQESATTAAEALDLCNVGLGQVREAVEAVIPPGAGARLGQDMTMTREAKRAIDKAYELARMVGVNYIGSEMLLMGIACVDCPAKTALEALEADARALAVAVRAICIREAAKAQSVEIPGEIDRRVKALAMAEKCDWGPLLLRLLIEALDTREAAPKPEGPVKRQRAKHKPVAVEEAAELELVIAPARAGLEE
jgi:ATP-dependent Clp protease ATP-binding subunit ClpA